MLNKLFRLCLDSKSEFNEIVKDYDLTFSQWQVLKAINTSVNKQLLVSEIVEELKSDKATISLMVKKLRDKNMVYMESDISDKRKKYIKLTDSMISRCQEMKTIEMSFTNSIFANLTTEEKELFEKLINKI